MSHIITLLFTGTVPPPPTHPGPSPIPPCNECPVGCENGNEPEQGMVSSQFNHSDLSSDWLKP